MQMHLATRDLGVAFRSGEAINPIGVGPRYIAFRTDDIDAFKRHLDAHGVQYADYGSRLAPDLFSRSAGEGVIIEVHAVLREGEEENIGVRSLFATHTHRHLAHEAWLHGPAAHCASPSVCLAVY